MSAKTKPAGTVTEEIMAQLKKHQPNTGMDAIDPALLKELEMNRAKWRKHQLVASRTALSRSISNVLKSRGYKIGERTVAKWLMEN